MFNKVINSLRKRLSTNLIVLLIGLFILASSGIAVASLTSSKPEESQLLTGVLIAPTPSPSPTPVPTIMPTPTIKPTAKPTISPTKVPSPSSTSTPTSTTGTSTSTSTSTGNSTSNSQSTSTQTNSPVISGMSASDANFGQYVNYTISGDRFGSTQGTITIYESNGNIIHNGMITDWQNNSVKVQIVGAAGTSYSIMVTTYEGKSSNRYSFSQPVGQPYFTPDSMNPKNAKPGETITISGDRFDSGNGKVTFDGAEGSVSSWNNNEIKVAIPGSLQAGKEVAVVVISSKGQQSSIHYYTLGN